LILFTETEDDDLTESIY